MKLTEWAAFWTLGLIWGSSFLWIKIAVSQMAPLAVAAFRLLFGLAGLLVVAAVRRQPFPRDPRRLCRYATLSAMQAALPFALISWGETRIDSGLAAILNGTTPLFTIVLAHLWLRDERISPPRMLGLIVGFVGVVVLGSRDIGPGGLHTSAWGQGALLAASLSYAAAATFSRRYLRGDPPLVQATLVVLSGDALLWAAVSYAERPLVISAAPILWIALVWLGLLGSCLAYLLYFYLINAWGATRASLVTYVFPVVGLILGLLFLGERLDWALALGSLLIVAGIIVVGRVTPAAPAAVAAQASRPVR